MKNTFVPGRLLAEVLALVALAETLVMLVLPVLAPPGLGALTEGLLDVALLTMMAGPAVYWRLMAHGRAAAATEAPEMPGTPQERTPRRLFHTAALLTAITQIAGLLLTAAGLWWQSGNLDSLSQGRFDQSVERIDTEVVRRLNQSVYGLKGARGAIAANPRFGLQEFRRYVASRDLPSEFPGIRGFGFIERVPRSALAAYVAERRAEGAPDYAAHTSGAAEDLLLVKYLEPLENNRQAIGFDLGQDPGRRAAVEYAIATGEPTLLAGITLVQDNQRTPGLLYLLPVYRTGNAPPTPAERQRALLGLLYAPIVARELLSSVSAATDPLVDFELYDGAGADPQHLIFDADGMPSTQQRQLRRHVTEHVLNVGSRVLMLRSSGRLEFETSQDRSSLALIGIGGTLLSCLMAMTVWLLAAGRQRAHELAESMTQELDRMAQVVQHTDNAVTIMDAGMRIQWVNRGFARITGYSLEQALGHTPGELLSSGKSAPRALQTLLEGARTGAGCRVELINRSRDGREYWADTEVQPLLDPQGQLVGFMEIGTDISQQKRTQHQLEAAMRDARALLNTVETHAIVSTTDAQGRITEVNDAFCRISGYSRAELVGQNHRLLKSGVQGSAFWAALWQTISSGQPWRGEICNRMRDGTLIWMDCMIAPFVGEDGQIEKYVSIRTDITERHLSAERLRQSEATFAASFQDAATGMGLLSPRGQWLMANPAMCEFLGLGQDELHEMTLTDVAHPEEWDTDQTQMQRLLDDEIRVYQRAKRYLHRDGHTVWGLASISVVRAEDGRPEFVIAQIVDITARKRAEEALGLSNALMEESQAVARVGGWELSLDSGHLYWTQEIYRIHETTPEDFHPTLEAGLAQMLPGSRERLQAALALARESGQGYDLELECLTCQGRRIEVRTTGSATLENGRIVRLSGIFQDITERKEYERSLKEARERAEAATQSKGQFLANMSHEIRTPMNAILGMLRLLHNTGLNARQRDYAEKTEGAARSLLALINDILDFSKVEAGKMALDAQPFAVERLLRSLAVILSSNLGPKPVELLYDVDPALPAVLLGDAMRLQQVLINLGGNAVKFTAQGQVIVRLRLLALDATAAQLEFAVEDSGIGIAPEHQELIFTGFSQAEASTTRKFGGTGLGLAISRRLVELMGGTLRLHSALGQGSTFAFTLTLPRVAQVPPELQEEPLAPGPARTVLVVDSNASARAVLAGMVQSWGWSAESADSGEAALQALQARLQSGAAGYAVIYLDWQMSGIDGWTTAARLRQLCARHGAPQPMLVMVSGSSREALEQRTLEEQALLNGFLMKPVTSAMLLEAALDAGNSPARLRQAQRGSASQRRLDGMRILVVEDNLINQQVAEELLHAEGARVSLAANGRLGVDAIAAAQAAGCQFDAVLMDIQMPVLDGLAATRLVRGELGLARLPIIAMTANAMDSDRQACLEAGMNDHVGKPFELRALVLTLLHVSGFQPGGASAAAPGEPQARGAGGKPGDAGGASTAAAHAVDAAGAGTHAAQADDAIALDAALARMGGQRALYLRAAREFLHQLPQLLAELAACTEAPQCALQAHSLKGTAALLGAQALALQAGQLERLCKHPDAAHGGWRPALDRLLELGQDCGARLQRLLHELEPAEPPAPAPPDAGAPVLPAAIRAALRAALGELMPLLAEDDFAALERFADLREVLAAAPAHFGALEEAMQALELERALVACRGLQAWLDDGAR